jgi:hypothetical protein
MKSKRVYGFVFSKTIVGGRMLALCTTFFFTEAVARNAKSKLQITVEGFFSVVMVNKHSGV